MEWGLLKEKMAPFVLYVRLKGSHCVRRYNERCVTGKRIGFLLGCGAGKYRGPRSHHFGRTVAFEGYDELVAAGEDSTTNGAEWCCVVVQLVLLHLAFARQVCGLDTSPSCASWPAGILSGQHRTCLQGIVRQQLECMTPQ
ncbi:unnamed protein product [Ostreobium quekettii]|uniref:Uncharacterized protein n=1 Tax=Ostreobium quekettii TaxID=121088 RepID=A0A8S1J1R5_9CHLO|nr:unnamed protein product [Ostreobium quekettii]